MAEPTDIPPKPAETGITAMPAMPSAEKPEAYRSVSILAILGFTLACLYAVIIFAGAVISFAFTRTPWLLPISLALAIPLIAAALCWVARGQILSSEGTLAGLPLTKWGMSISFIFALGYVAYFAATAVAVRQQAATFAGQYFEALQRGEIDRAFLLTRPPSSRPAEGTGQRDAIENELNDTPDPKMPGAYSDFYQKDYVRVLRQAGADAKVELLSVGDWDYREGGFKVPMRYLVKTPLVAFEMLVTVLSREGRGGKDARGRAEAKGRQWIIVPAETRVESAYLLTHEGEAVIKRFASARQFAQDWAFKVSTGRDWDAIYLDCLPPEQRKTTQQLLERADPPMAATGVVPLLLSQQDCLAWLQKKAQLSGADFVRTDKQQFWADPQTREEMIASVRKVFQEGARQGPPASVTLTAPPIPLWSSEGGKVRFGIDFQMLQLTKFKAEGVIYLETDAAKALPDPSDWRIESIDMLRARSAPNMPPGMEVAPP
jgi:hypothetical protein